MKKLLRVLGFVVFAGVLVIALAMVYSTANGYMTWFFRVNGEVTVDGQTNGYLHANTRRTILLITRTDRSRPETYLVPLADNGMIVDCGEWHPIRFLPIPVGGSNPPCSAYDTPAKFVDAPTSRAQITLRRSIEFTTASGKKIKAGW